MRIMLRSGMNKSAHPAKHSGTCHHFALYRSMYVSSVLLRMRLLVALRRTSRCLRSTSSRETTTTTSITPTTSGSNDEAVADNEDDKDELGKAATLRLRFAEFILRTTTLTLEIGVFKGDHHRHDPSQWQRHEDGRRRRRRRRRRRQRRPRISHNISHGCSRKLCGEQKLLHLRSACSRATTTATTPASGNDPKTADDEDDEDDLE